MRIRTQCSRWNVIVTSTASWSLDSLYCTAYLVDYSLCNNQSWNKLVIMDQLSNYRCFFSMALCAKFSRVDWYLKRGYQRGIIFNLSKRMDWCEINTNVSRTRRLNVWVTKSSCIWISHLSLVISRTSSKTSFSEKNEAVQKTKTVDMIVKFESAFMSDSFVFDLVDFESIFNRETRSWWCNEYELPRLISPYT